MPKSAGILVYRQTNGQIEFLLLKPGGPFYQSSDNGVWTIPKGRIEQGETEIEAAKREFREETGFSAEFDLHLLGEFKLRKGKNLVVYLMKADFDLEQMHSKEFEMEYPNNSGKTGVFSEIEKGAWMTFDEAQSKIVPSQLVILEKGEELIK